MQPQISLPKQNEKYAFGDPRYSSPQPDALAPPRAPSPRHSWLPPPSPSSEPRKTLFARDTWIAGSPAELLPQPVAKPLAAAFLEFAGDFLDFGVGIVAEFSERIDERAAAEVRRRERTIEPVEIAQDLLGDDAPGRNRVDGDAVLADLA